MYISSIRIYVIYVFTYNKWYYKYLHIIYIHIHILDSGLNIYMFIMRMGHMGVFLCNDRDSPIQIIFDSNSPHYSGLRFIITSI